MANQDERIHSVGYGCGCPSRNPLERVWGIRRRIHSVGLRCDRGRRRAGSPRGLTGARRGRDLGQAANAEDQGCPIHDVAKHFGQ